jgi:AraC family transcriptional regulator of adaptative response/methylated-DNA-[protein]-cysteine methyltransferase
MNNLDYYRIEKAINYLQANFKSQPSLEQLAEAAGLSTFHFQKIFKKWAGISPKKFIQFLTIEYAKDKLKQTNLMNTTYDSGLSSTSRVHELFVNVEAVTPKEFKSLGKDLIIYYGFHNSPFGLCLIAATDRGICNLFFLNENEKVKALNEIKEQWSNATFIEDARKTDKYFKQIFNSNIKEKLNVFVKGTNFQIQVWKALLKIPEGNLTTYENVARAIGSPRALRAVGTAVGSNPISYLIPCHRVINKMGIIGNYRWGSDRKRAMIGWEASKINNL